MQEVSGLVIWGLGLGPYRNLWRIHEDYGLLLGDYLWGWCEKYPCGIERDKGLRFRA